MVVSTRALIEYARNLKDTALNDLDLSDDLRKEFIEASDKIYDLSEQMLKIERGK